MADYLTIAALRSNGSFRDRTAVAVIKYAGYVSAEDPATQFHEFRLQWARKALYATDEMVTRMLGFILADAQVQTDLETISDANLQAVVETAIQNHMAVL